MDHDAFQTNVLPLKSKLFRFALRILGDPDEAKDVVQEVFARVWAREKRCRKFATGRPGVCGWCTTSRSIASG